MLVLLGGERCVLSGGCCFIFLVHGFEFLVCWLCVACCLLFGVVRCLLFVAVCLLFG